jgi:hypothetical protein
MTSARAIIIRRRLWSAFMWAAVGWLIACGR